MPSGRPPSEPSNKKSWVLSHIVPHPRTQDLVSEKRDSEEQGDGFSLLASRSLLLASRFGGPDYSTEMMYG